MDKWEKLKHYINADISHAVHHSHDKLFEHNVSLRYKKYMEDLEKEEKEYLAAKIEKAKELHKEMMNDLQGLS